MHQFFRRWQICEQMRENLLRSVDDEAIRHTLRLVERYGQCLGFGLAA